MSTPVSRNNRLDGLALYAPRRTRPRALPDVQAAPTVQPQQADGGLALAESRAPLSESALAEIEERVDQAIREVISLTEQSDISHAPGAASAAHSPKAAMAQRRSLEFEALSSQATRPQPLRTPPRQPRLDPEIVPEPPEAWQQTSIFRPLLRFSLVIMFAAVLAYGLTLLASSPPDTLWFKGASERVAQIASQFHDALTASGPPPRLAVEDREAFANEPLTLTVGVEHPRDDESLLLDGLAQGTTLSAGMATGPFSWSLPFQKIHGLYLYAPKDFVGVMNTTVDLFGADRRLLDSRAMELKWMARESKPASAPVRVATAGTVAMADREGAAKAGPPAIEPMDLAEATMLMQRGRDFLGAGDISAARIVFGRLAAAGVADAALALAGTYDPDYLAAHNVVGVSGDRAKARALYERAEQLGSAQAGRILAQMSVK